MYGDLTYSPDGSQLYESGSVTEIGMRAFDPRTGAVAWQEADVSGFANRGVYSTDGRSLFTADHAGDVTERDPVTGAARRVVASTSFGGVSGLDVSNNNRRVMVSSAAEGKVASWSLDRSGALVRVFGRPGERPVGLTPDEKSLLVQGTAEASQYGPLSVWDLASGDQVINRIPDIFTALPSGNATLVAAFGDLTIGRYDLRRRRRIPPRTNIRVPGIQTFEINVEKQLLALGRTNGTVELYDVRTGRPSRSPLRVRGPVSNLGFDPTATRLAVSTLTGQGSVFDLATGHKVVGPVPNVSSLAFTSDGKGLYIGSPDGQLRQVDAKTLEPVGKPFARLAGVPLKPQVSADGSTISINDHSRRVRILDADSHVQIGEEFLLNQTGAGSLARSGRFLVIGARQGPVEIWDIQPTHWRRAACRLAGRNLTATEWATYLPNAGTYHRTCEEWPAAR